MTNKIEARLSPCLTLYVDLKIESMFSVVKLIVVFLYSFLRTIIIFSGTPHRARIFQRSLQLTVSCDFAKSMNIAWTDCSCSRNVCKLRLIAKFASWQPFLLDWSVLVFASNFCEIVAESFCDDRTDDLWANIKHCDAFPFIRVW